MLPAEIQSQPKIYPTLRNALRSRLLDCWWWRMLLSLQHRSDTPLGLKVSKLRRGTQVLAREL